MLLKGSLHDAMVQPFLVAELVVPIETCPGNQDGQILRKSGLEL